MNLPDFKPSKIDHISYSFLNLALCPYASFLRYDGGIKVKPTPWLVLGSAVHQGLEEAHTAAGFDFPTAVRVFRKYYNETIEEEEVFVGYPQLKKLEAEGIQMLEKYYGQIQSGEISAQPLVVEKEFSIEISGQLAIVGRIDKVEYENDGYIVTDYKSGKPPPDSWFLSHDLQFTAYAWASLILYGQLPRKMYFHHLRTGKRFETVRTLEDINDLKKRIEDVLKMRELGINHRVYNSKVCNSCDFKGETCDSKELESKILEGLRKIG